MTLLLVSVGPLGALLRSKAPKHTTQTPQPRKIVNLDDQYALFEFSTSLPSYEQFERELASLTKAQKSLVRTAATGGDIEASRDAFRLAMDRARSSYDKLTGQFSEQYMSRVTESLFTSMAIDFGADLQMLIVAKPVEGERSKAKEQE